MSSLKQEKELNMFVNETLSIFDIKVEEVNDTLYLRNKLSNASFSAYLNYINSL